MRADALKSRAPAARTAVALLTSRALAPRTILALLALVVAVGGLLRVTAAAAPDPGYLSLDARSYARLAVGITHGDYQQLQGSRTQDLRWPPGAPALFAAAITVVPAAPAARAPADLPAAYWLQALISTATLALVFALGALLAGPPAGLVAAALVALYPPLISINGALMSETLGAALATGAVVLLVVALRARSWRLAAAAGAAFGLLILTRADFLLALPLLGLLVALVTARQGARLALGHACAFFVAGLVVLAPWVLYASHRADRLVPVTSGGGAPLFVGTYLPGGGTTIGLKKALEPQLRARFPGHRKTATFKIPAELALKLVAERHPELSRDAALTLEARRNLVRYGLGDPIAFTAMMLSKVERMWLKYYRGGGVHYISTVTRGFHWLLVALGVCALAGLLVRRRLTAGFAVVFVLAAYSTLLHAVVVSQARYNLPLVPIVVAAGVAGLTVAFSGRRPVQQTVQR